MNLIAYGHKFFIFGGAILIATAVLQILIRPRAKAGARTLRLLDATTIKAVLFVSVGLLAILMGAGIIPMAMGH